MASVVMYHRVRPESTRYDLNYLNLENFKYQIKYISSNYDIIGYDELVGHIKGGVELPKKVALLTFDDGYTEHFTQVFPYLHERNIEGFFFPPVNAIVNDTVLNVNKIHYIVATADNGRKLKSSVFDILDKHRNKFNYASNEHLYESTDKQSRWDTEDVTFVKRLLQRGLEYPARSRIINDLFEEYVDVSEQVLSNEIYITRSNISTMLDAGMYVGGHGATHRWLEYLTYDEQENEIEETLAFLEDAGVSTRDWIMCYPYGSYNSDTLDLLEDKDCAAAFTTAPKVADLSSSNPLTLPRLDTNDLPQKPSDR